MSVNSIQPGWYSIEGAATYTGFSVSSIRTAIDEKLFPAKRVKLAGKGSKPNVRIRREHLDRWIEEGPFTPKEVAK